MKLEIDKRVQKFLKQIPVKDSTKALSYIELFEKYQFNLDARYLKNTKNYQSRSKNNSVKAERISMKTKPKTISVSELKKELLKNKNFKLEYESQLPESQIACQVIEARLKQNMSQVELANKIHSGQAVISRLESLNSKPSLSLLIKIAKALDTKIN